MKGLLMSLKSSRLFHAVLFWGLIFHCVGCTTTSVMNTPSQTSAVLDKETDFKIDLSQPLGFIKESGADPASIGIAQWGVAQDVKTNWDPNKFGLKTKGEQLQFPRTIKQLYWYASFSMEGMLKHQVPKAYNIEWVQPDGKIFQKNSFKSSFWNETYLKTKINLPQPIAENLIGRWRVRVWSKNHLIDDRYFEIVGG